jgi:hypothetical protein
MDALTQDTVGAEIMRLTQLAHDKRPSYFDPLARPVSGAEELIGSGEENGSSLAGITLADVDQAACELAAATGYSFEDIMSVVRAGATGRDAAELALSMAALADGMLSGAYGGGGMIGLAVSQDERDQLAETGQALPGGDFPIPDAHHLALAKGEYAKGNLAGHSKAEVRRHINENAKRLGLPGLDDDEDHDSGDDEDDVQASQPRSRLARDSSGAYTTVPLSGSYDYELPEDYGIAARAQRDLARYAPETSPDAEAEIARLSAEYGDYFGLARPWAPAAGGQDSASAVMARHPEFFGGRRGRGKTHLHSGGAEDDTMDRGQPRDGGDVHAEIARYLKMRADELGGEAAHAGRHGSDRYPAKSRIQREAEERRARSRGTGASGGPHGHTLMPSR